MDDRQSAAGDWITIWHSEISAAATDRGRAEAWSMVAAAWADWARAMTGAARADGPSGPAASAPPVGAAAAADAPDARDRILAELAARVDELERRLANKPAG